MNKVKWDQRISLYHHNQKALKALTDQSLIDNILTTERFQGWGDSCTIHINGKSVFVKLIPLTELERAHPDSTANLFNLPLYYQYGVGSAGFGANRELKSHQKTSQWVLSQENPNFPLLYHNRVLKLDKTDRKVFDEQAHQEYLKAWNNSPEIDAYIRGRHETPYYIALFLEHIPYVLGHGDWFANRTHRIKELNRTLQSTIQFLQQQDIRHFDLHFHNVITDGDDFYITDSGLTIDKSFDLSKAELEFFDNHPNYDFATYLTSTAWHLGYLYETADTRVQANIDQSIGTSLEQSFPVLLSLLLRNKETVSRLGLEIDHTYSDHLEKYLPTMTVFNDSIRHLIENRKDLGRYPSMPELNRT